MPTNTNEARNQADERLAKVLGNGDASAYIRYVQKHTKKLPFKDLVHIAKVFTEGTQVEFERLLVRVEGTSARAHEGRTLPQRFAGNGMLPGEKVYPWDP